MPCLQSELAAKDDRRRLSADLQGHSSTGRPLVLPATLRPLRSKPICHLRHTLPRTGQLHSLEAHQVSSVQTFNLEESSEQERDQ